MGARAQFVLPGGGPARLGLRANVLACRGQQLMLRLDDEDVIVRAAPEGTLDVRVPIPASPGPRHVTVAWAHAVELSEDDPREVAARIEYLDLLPLRSPTALRIPASLAVWGGDQTGIDSDGWTGRSATVRLAGGDEAVLGVRGDIPTTLERQELTISVDDARVFQRTLESGPFAVTVPVAAAADDRAVELRWSETTFPAPDDDREVAGRLTFIGIASGDPPTAVGSDLRALADPRLRFEGIYPDGWLAKTAMLELEQGNRPELVVKARTLQTMDGQTLDIRVDGELVHAMGVESRFVSARIPIEVDPGGATRCVELLWSEDEPLGRDDRRFVAAHLAFVGFVTPRPPAMITAASDIADPHLDVQGLDEDFWFRDPTWVTLAAGPAVDLVVRARLDRTRTQSIDVFVDGTRIGAAVASGESIELRVPLPAADGPRRVELRAATTFSISPSDPREVAGRLIQIGLEAPRKRLLRRP